MKVIIAGSRTIQDYRIVKTAIERSGFKITEVVSGTARGVDVLGERWAMDHNLPIKQFPADWDGNGRGAGYIRNMEMADYADALIAVWNGRSKGTQHMIATARKKDMEVFCFEYKE